MQSLMDSEMDSQGGGLAFIVNTARRRVSDTWVMRQWSEDGVDEQSREERSGNNLSWRSPSHLNGSNIHLLPEIITRLTARKHIKSHPTQTDRPFSNECAFVCVSTVTQNSSVVSVPVPDAGESWFCVELMQRLVEQWQSGVHCCSAPLWDNTVLTAHTTATCQRRAI